MSEQEVRQTYEVLRSPKLDVLEAQVNDALDAGYSLQGGICVVSRENSEQPFVYYQAVVGTTRR